MKQDGGKDWKWPTTDRPVDVLKHLIADAEARRNNKLARFLAEAAAEYLREETASWDQAEAHTRQNGAT